VIVEALKMKGKRKSAAVILGLLTAISSLLIVPDTLADRGGERRWGPPGNQHGAPYYPARRGHGYRPHHRPYYRRPFYRGPYYWGDAYKIDADPYKYLAITAIALKLLDNLDANQQRRHESAMAAATMAPVGEPIVWQDGNASGSVRTVRIGESSSGLQCREFQHTVTIGGRTQQAYGTSCLQPDGSWQIVNTR
jgi:hypothetical protein